MLYVKLALRNLKRSLKEYSIYVFTVTITMTLLYAFFAIAFSGEMQDLVTTYDNIKSIMIMVSILVTLIIAWLIYYISNFILQKRSREFGMYLLLGMKRTQVSRMFLFEQLALGAVGFFIGCVLGIFVYEILHAILLNIFGFAYAFQLSFSWSACGAAFLCFLSIYLLEMIREGIALKKQSIHTMLYNASRNEKTAKGSRLSGFYFLAAVLLAVAGLYVTQQYLRSMVNGQSSDSMLLMLGVFAIIVSVYLFFYGISAVLGIFLNRHRKIKYKGNCMYLYGQIAGRLRSNRTVLATLSLLTLLTLLFLCIALKFNEVKELSNARFVPFDIMASSSEKLNMKSIESYLQEHKISYQSADIHYYQKEERDDFYSVVKGKSYYTEDEKHSVYMKQSDFNKLRSLKGKPSVTLKADEYLIVCATDIKDSLQEYGAQHTLHLQGKRLQLRGVDDTEYGQTRNSGYYLIVADEHVKHAKPYFREWVANTDPETEVSWYQDTVNQFFDDNKEQVGDSFYSYASYRVKAKWFEENAVGFVGICFSLFYLSFIFICTSATIFAFPPAAVFLRNAAANGGESKIVSVLAGYRLRFILIIPLVLPIADYPQLDEFSR